MALKLVFAQAVVHSNVEQAIVGFGVGRNQHVFAEQRRIRNRHHLRMRFQGRVIVAGHAHLGALKGEHFAERCDKALQLPFFGGLAKWRGQRAQSHASGLKEIRAFWFGLRANAPDVDMALDAHSHQQTGMLNIQWNSQRARDIVHCAKRNNAQRGLAAKQLGKHILDCAVAAGHNHELNAAFGCVARKLPRDFARSLQSQISGNAIAAQALNQLFWVARLFLRGFGARVEDQQGVAQRACCGCASRGAAELRIVDRRGMRGNSGFKRVQLAAGLLGTFAGFLKFAQLLGMAVLCLGEFGHAQRRACCVACHGCCPNPILRPATAALAAGPGATYDSLQMNMVAFQKFHKTRRNAVLRLAGQGGQGGVARMLEMLPLGMLWRAPGGHFGRKASGRVDDQAFVVRQGHVGLAFARRLSQDIAVVNLVLRAADMIEPVVRFPVVCWNGQVFQAIGAQDIVGRVHAIMANHIVGSAAHPGDRAPGACHIGVFDRNDLEVGVAP